MAKTISTEPSATLDSERSARFFHEINLLRIEGCYFSFNRKKSSNINKETFTDIVKIGDGTIETSITIEPHPTYGKPSVLAYKILQVVLKKYSNYGYPFPDGVPLGQREIARLIGRKSMGGTNKIEFDKAIKQLRMTGIECSFFIKKLDKKNKISGQWKSVNFSIFSTALMSGRKPGKVEQGFFCLHPIIVYNLNNRYTFCLNFPRMENLEPIGFAIFKRLFFHFSNIYSQNKNKSFKFIKDYGSICKSWIGGLKVLKYRSKIINEQLGHHLKVVKKTGLLKKFDVGKNSRGDGFNLIFYPGKGFFDDYQKYYGRFPQVELPFKEAVEKRYIKQPMSLVNYFYQKLLNTDELEPKFLSQTEVDQASSLLKKYSYKDIKDWIDFSIEQARLTGFKIKKFGGIINYKTEFFVNKDQIQKKKLKEKDDKLKQAEQLILDEYEVYKRDEIEKYKNQLKKEELDKIEAEIWEKAKKKHTNNQLQSKMYFFQAKRKYLYELANTLSFEEWQKKYKCGV